jgi:muramidase (phage lysozyme)
MARSPIFDNVDPDLLSLIQGVAGNYAPYKASIISGFRGGDPRFHGSGRALDVQLADPKTGVALPNYQNATNAQQYQEFANAVYAAASPEMKAKLRWGGYFGGKPGKYGAFDLMHFDTGMGENGLGMEGGSWGGGFTPEQMKTWGIANAGGAGGAPAGVSPEAWKQAFLNSIASGESPGYDVEYGGAKFSDYSKHPHAMQTANGITSDAAGRYQFLGKTWDEQAAKYGYKDFSPQTQDTAAWNYASDIYKQSTGGDLAEALQSNDPARINAAAQVLNKTWSSLPGGAEQSKGYGDKTFYDIYSGNLKNPVASAAPGWPGAGTGSTAPATASASTAKPADATKKDPAEAANKLMAGLEQMAGGGQKTSSVPNVQAPMTRPIAMMTQPGPGMSYGGGASPEGRQALALAMQRLNSGKLW